jgi:hypothetical protein
MFMNEVFLKELKNSISSIVREELQKYLITEMAMSSKDYKKRVESLMQQILENWCLIRYTTLTNDKLEYRNYWSSELKAHLNNIASLKLKNGDSSEQKEKIIYSLWNMYDWDTDERCISQRLFTKFETENLPTYGNTFAQIITDFKNETKNIVNILISKSSVDISNYVKNI